MKVALTLLYKISVYVCVSLIQGSWKEVSDFFYYEGDNVVHGKVVTEAV